MSRNSTKLKIELPDGRRQTLLAERLGHCVTSLTPAALA